MPDAWLLEALYPLVACCHLHSKLAIWQVLTHVPSCAGELMGRSAADTSAAAVCCARRPRRRAGGWSSTLVLSACISCVSGCTMAAERSCWSVAGGAAQCVRCTRSLTSFFACRSMLHCSSGGCWMMTGKMVGRLTFTAAERRMCHVRQQCGTMSASRIRGLELVTA